MFYKCGLRCEAADALALRSPMSNIGLAKKTGNDGNTKQINLNTEQSRIHPQFHDVYVTFCQVFSWCRLLQLRWWWQRSAGSLLPHAALLHEARSCRLWHQPARLQLAWSWLILKLFSRPVDLLKCQSLQTVVAQDFTTMSDPSKRRPQSPVILGFQYLSIIFLQIYLHD